MKKFGIFIIVIILIGAIMLLLNPNMDNFNSFLERTANRNIKKYASGNKDALDSLLDGKMPGTDTFYSEGFERQDYYIFSTYENPKGTNPDGNRYLGLFKVFIKME